MRKVLVQRLQPLSIEYKKKAPFLRKITYHYEGIFRLDETISGEQEFIKMLFDRFGSGSYQLLGWKKYPMRLRSIETEKILSKDKAFPFFKLAIIIIETNGRGRFIYNRMRRYFEDRERLEHHKTFKRRFNA